MFNFFKLLFILFPLSLFSQDSIFFKHKITEGVTPKSIVHSGDGLFAAQNMMYKHTVTFYDRNYRNISTVHDDVDLSKYDTSKISMMNWGAPVEGTFSDKGKYYWITNYQMNGGNYNKPGCDLCSGKNYDKSYVYKINTWTYKVEKAVEVGSVPKFIAANDLLKIVVVSNWTSGDVTLIDSYTNKVLKQVSVGKFPRGIAVSPTKKKIYVSLMGERRIAVIDVLTYQVTYIENVGTALRHLCLDEAKGLLYVSIQDEKKVAKINLVDNSVTYVEVGKAPRSMTLTADGKFLYVVNYGENTFSKIKTDSLKVTNKIKTAANPIGIAVDEKKGEIWVACYVGEIDIFQDASIAKGRAYQKYVSDVLAEQKKMIKIEKKKKIKEENQNIGGELWYAVAGVFKDKNNAIRLRDELISKGYSAEIVNGKNGMNQVIYGKGTMDQVMNLMEQIRKKGGEVWMKRR